MKTLNKKMAEFTGDYETSHVSLMALCLFTLSIILIVAEF